MQTKAAREALKNAKRQQKEADQEDGNTAQEPPKPKAAEESASFQGSPPVSQVREG